MEVTEEIINNCANNLLVNVKILRGVGPQLADKLARLNIISLLDLFLHVPYKYLDKTRITNIADAQINTHAVIEGIVIDVKIIITKAGQRNLILYLQDSTGVIELRFFHWTSSQMRGFTNHGIYGNQDYPVKLRCFGEIKYGTQALCMIHPEYDLVLNIKTVNENLTPVYPSTEGLSQKRWVQIINTALEYLDKINNKSSKLEYLPQELIKKYNLLNFADAIKFVHQPPADSQLDLLENKSYAAQQRLIFDELLAHYLAMQLIRNKQHEYSAPANNLDFLNQLNQINSITRFIKLLPFDLTSAQTRVADEIIQELRTSRVPMSRLLQGDVGSGKTIIAAIAMLHIVDMGYQAVLMAPTEILAEQHFNNLSYYFNQLGIKSELLTSKISNQAKDVIKSSLKNNEIKIIIGTHALIQDYVEFNKLGLIVIDEQHRFGVEQRLKLWQKGVKNNIAPHQLTMTATPIPRTLAMTLYADMDYSVLDQLPAGRKTIQTVVISDQKKLDVITRIKTICAQGRQVYWVCTLIDESDVLACAAAEQSYQELISLLPDLKIGLVHGRLKAQQKSAIMSEFKANKLNILVATTVIEVGVDVPNASLMIIENSERLGLSQLHQLRGRVGRGQYDSYCVLLYQTPLSKTAKSRLEIIKTCNDGFKLAEYDLQLRGSGELLGKRQTGTWQLKTADLIRDKDKLTQIIKASQYIKQHYPEFIIPLVKLWLGENYKLGVV